MEEPEEWTHTILEVYEEEAYEKPVEIKSSCSTVEGNGNSTAVFGNEEESREDRETCE